MSDFDAVRARIRDSFSRQGLMRTLGAELVTIEPGIAMIRLAHSDEITQQHGYIHAGATSSIADAAGGYAAMTWMDVGNEVLTVEYKINLIAPASTPILEATGTVVHTGGRLSVCSLEVIGVDGSERVLVATGQQTLYRLTTGR